MAKSPLSTSTKGNPNKAPLPAGSHIPVLKKIAAAGIHSNARSAILFGRINPSCDTATVCLSYAAVN